MTFLAVTATIIGAVILTALALAITTLVLGIAGMLVLLAATRHRRTGLVPAARFRASSDVWATRWSRYLRHIFRSHHRVGGEPARIQRIGLGAFLWCDDATVLPRSAPWPSSDA